MADQIEVPVVPRGFRNAPSDIKERAAALVRDFGSNPALLEGAIVAALETERLASSPDQVKRETIEACAQIASNLSAAQARIERLETALKEARYDRARQAKETS